MRITTAEIPPDWKEEIEEIAQATGRTSGEVVREAIAQYLSETDPLTGQLVHATRVSYLYRRAVLCSVINNPVKFIHSKLECANQYVPDLLQLLHLYATYYSSPVLEIQEYAEEIELEFLLENIPKITIFLKTAANLIAQYCQNTADLYSLDKVQPKVIEFVKEAICQYLGKNDFISSQLLPNESPNSRKLMPHLGMEFNNPVQFMLGNLASLSECIQDLFKLLRLYARYYPPIVPEIQQYAEAIKLEFLVEDLPNVINYLQIEANRLSQLIIRLHRFGTRTMPFHERLDSLVLSLQPQQNALENPTDIQVIKEYGSVPELRGDFAWLTLVLINLLILAIHTIEESTASKLEARDKKSDLQPLDPILKPTLRICTQLDEKNQVVIRIGDYRIQLSLDSEQRLHAEAEPAITWGNGYGLYCYHGVTLPEKYGKLPPREWQAQFRVGDSHAG